MKQEHRVLSWALLGYCVGMVGAYLYVILGGPLP